MPSISRLPVVFLLAALGAAPGTEPLATRQTAFSIPFRFDAPLNPAERPVEVQLYVSTDRGGAWKLHSKVPPAQGRFPFKAEKDGEYWFLIRTKDNTGRLFPNKPNLPEMQVLVDTAQPSLELTATRGEAGEVVIRWRATDPNLQPQNLRLDYQAQGAADLWQSIAIDPRRTQVLAGICLGEVTLWAKETTETLVIRGEVTDRAGNLAVTQEEVAAKGQPEAATSAADPPPVAAPAYPDTGLPVLETPKQPSATTPVTGEVPDPATKPPGKASIFPALGWRWPAEGASKPLTRSNTRPPASAPLVVQRLQTTATATTTSASTAPSANAASAASVARESAADWVQPPLTDVVRPAPHRPGNSVAAVGSISSVVASGYRPPPGIRPRMVNSRTFQLEYDLGGNLPGGARKVELWGTRDGGQRWSSYGADADVQSPMTVTVEGEGMYGFRILVQSGTGMIEFPPQKGDRPETWVAVDVTRPTCRLTQTLQQLREQAEQLQIAWEASDEWLAERPISLSYSQQSVGPWLPIATGLENTGRYVWPLDANVPERLYLRLEARDQAGNVEVFQSPDAVTLTRQSPPGRIREVRPTYESSQGPQRCHFW